MTSPGLVLVSGAASAGALGFAGYFAARRSAWKSRAAALALFGHGALGTSGLLFLMVFVRLDAFGAVRIPPLEESLRAAFDCDWEWSCVAIISGFVALVVLSCSFVLSQLISRAMIGREIRRGATPFRIPKDAKVRGLLVEDPAPDAYSVALLSRAGRRLRVEDYVVITTGLRNLLDPTELAVVIEHELAHVRGRDNRYLPYFHALTAIVFFDPFLRSLRRDLGHRYELEADRMAAFRTRRPLALASALLKVFEASTATGTPAALLGASRGPEILERIQRLLAFAETGKYT